MLKKKTTTTTTTIDGLKIHLQHVLLLFSVRNSTQDDHIIVELQVNSYYISFLHCSSRSMLLIALQ